MKPIKFLLSLCAVLMVAVGAMAQISSISAPTGVPASVCGGSTITLASAPTIVENPAGSCVGQALQLVAINLADNSDLATGSAGTVGSPTGGTLTLPATASPSTANIALRYRVTGGVCTFNAGTLSSNIAWTNNTLTVPNLGGLSVSPNPVCEGAPITVSGISCATGNPVIYTSQTGSTTITSPFPAVAGYTYYAACVDGACVSPRVALPSSTVNPLSLPSGQLNLVQSCVGASPAAPTIGFTCSNSGTAILVDATTGLELTPASFTTGTTYQVGGGCKTAGGCITPVANLVNVQPYTATSTPLAPTAVGVSKVGGTSATTATVCPEAPLQFYGTCNAGQLKIVGPSPATTMVLQGSKASATPATYTYALTCITVNGCEGASETVTVIVQALPAAPTTTALTASVCQGGQVSVTTNGCASGETLKFYTTATGSAETFFKDQNGAGTNPTSGIMPEAGTFKFYPACVSAIGCEGPRNTTGVTVTVTARPGKPSFTAATPIAPMVVCANTSAGQPLQNNLTCSNSTQLLVWLKGGVQVSQPNTQPAETTTWKVVCKSTGSDGCVSDTTTVVYTVNPRGTNPTGVSLTAAGTTVNAGGNATICSSDASTPITFTGCPAGETLWYRAGGGEYMNSTVTPATQAVGTTVFYSIKCQLGDCFSANESTPMQLTINKKPSFKPVATLTPGNVCATAPASTPFGGSSTCGEFATVWFEVTAGGDVELASLPSTIPATAKTYYAKCKDKNAPANATCYSEKSDNVTFNIIPNATAPVITSIGGTEVCTGVNVTLTTNCPSGSVVKWSTGAEGNALALVSDVPQVRAVTAKCVTTVGSTTCESPVSATTTVVWKTFDITIINIGSPLSGVKPGSNVPKSAWAANFVTVDAGPSLQSSSQGNPSVFFTENPNKGADRFWTVHVESCALGTAGAISYDMLVTPEAGVPYSYNTVENNAPYLMYANRDGFTELYAHNHGAYGFTSEPKYTQGLPKGLYKLSIRYWSEKGMGLYPAVRTAQGTQLAYQEYWFRIQSQNGIGSGAAREGVTENTEAPFVTMGQNPVTRTLSLTINGAKGQDVKLNLVDASGRSIKVSSVTPETNTHREEIDMTSQNTGMYFIQVSTPSKRAALKVLKVSQD
ncbi:T9SS type A sorting domain-containing protein [Runella limosa]|uniref:T9SS type A sorting domain-containing protein n=1 Tax=Runella limosa TaxID=370978 RepID=UPI000427838E|nr:T9SS type A sorting domain-containing protein [Runella limosa]